MEFRRVHFGCVVVAVAGAKLGAVAEEVAVAGVVAGGGQVAAVYVGQVVEQLELEL